MKLTALLFIGFVMPLHCSGQTSEFETYANGYIYDEKTMGQLQYIVDSLNLAFLGCDLTRTYYAKFQAYAHYIELDTGNIKEAKRALENNMPFEQFVAKFPECKKELNTLVVKFLSKDYEGKDFVEFVGLPHTSIFQLGSMVRKDPSFYTRNMNQQWLIDYTKETNYSQELLMAYYFTTDFKAQPLTEKYSRLIQYSDCLIDTNGIIFTNADVGPNMDYKEYQKSKVGQLLTYIHTETKQPEYREEDYEQYYKEMQAWNEISQARIDSLFQANARCLIMLEDAVPEALAKGYSNDEFESYVAQYISKKTALDLKRNRKVVGFCSMDQGPRIHAREIAILSAETVQWDIFLRAHLDIMNDNFERASDGNYAWERRETYIHELEDLNINVIDLLLGISLRAENPSQNHYYGNIGRLGRALAETQDPEAFESTVLSMIVDQDLDDFNRLIMFYLFSNYKNYSLKEDMKEDMKDEMKDEISKDIRDASQLLPEKLALKFKE